MSSALAGLGWWLLCACAIPMAVIVLAMAAFPPRLRVRRAPSPVTVISVRAVPEAEPLPSSWLEIEP